MAFTREPAVKVLCICEVGPGPYPPVIGVLPLPLQQRRADAVLALQQQKGVQTAAEHVQQSTAHTHTHTKHKILVHCSRHRGQSHASGDSIWLSVSSSLLVARSTPSANAVFPQQLAVAKCELSLSRKPQGKRSWLIFTCR